MLVDIALDGHHIPYMKGITQNKDNTYIYVLPQQTDELAGKQYIVKPEGEKRSFLKYRGWLANVKDVAKNEKPDLICFLYGDAFYKYFGSGLLGFGRKKTIVTFHQISRNKIKELSVKLILKKISKGIVHTEDLKKRLESMGVKNCVHIEYPYFGPKATDEVKVEKARLGIKDDKPVLGIIGGLRHDKGIDIFLDVLPQINKDCHVIIAGHPGSYDPNFIKDKVKASKKDCKLILRFLEEKELISCVNACDLIVLPYRFVFEGASGPLTLGVFLGKKIIGPSHGSLGDIITKNDLGYTFKTEDAEDLKNTINKAIEEKNFSLSEKGKEYRNSIDEKNFYSKYSEIFNSIKK